MQIGPPPFDLFHFCISVVVFHDDLVAIMHKDVPQFMEKTEPENVGPVSPIESIKTVFSLPAGKVAPCAQLLEKSGSR